MAWLHLLIRTTHQSAPLTTVLPFPIPNPYPLPLSYSDEVVLRKEGKRGK
jgi:hypothetical protein